jgi:hypothetical protein
VIGSRAEGSGLRARGSGKSLWLAIAAFVAIATFGLPASGQSAALTLRATVNGAPAPNGLTITLERWSTDAERAPVVAALAVRPPAPAPPAGAGAAAGRAAGRGGRAGGRGAPPPASPAVRLSAAIKAAPTLGYIWGDGVTGYSIKYAWRAADRIVLITDRRLGAHAPEWALPQGPAADAEYTLIEMHLDAKGVGEAKTSLGANVAIDTAANTLALDGYAAAPALLRITR